ncbi:hypothetical protein E2C01_077378 [Portunus trituberculatus]|uniref:Uncharacterized protein n=1 Tax=Portunus trituberculatus TaxID=210409 RepID=A0A5B7ILZ4_PORTR|nr:hypothetical protein [Portunus trituberculatus]
MTSQAGRVCHELQTTTVANTLHQPAILLQQRSWADYLCRHVTRGLCAQLSCPSLLRDITTIPSTINTCLPYVSCQLIYKITVSINSLVLNHFSVFLLDTRQSPATAISSQSTAVHLHQHHNHFLDVPSAALLSPHHNYFLATPTALLAPSTTISWLPCNTSHPPSQLHPGSSRNTSGPPPQPFPRRPHATPSYSHYLQPLPAAALLRSLQQPSAIRSESYDEPGGEAAAGAMSHSHAASHQPQPQWNNLAPREWHIPPALATGLCESKIFISSP